MGRKYIFHGHNQLYFVSFATVNWVDVFVRRIYCDIMVDSLRFCIENKGLELYAWCIMSSHVHLIISTEEGNLSDIIRDMKRHTAKQILKAIEENVQESRREWMLWMFKRAGEKNSNVTNGQFWQQHNKPIELWSNEVIDQKVDYIHNNPVEAGFVTEDYHWKYSSAIDFSGEKGLLEIDMV